MFKPNFSSLPQNPLRTIRYAKKYSIAQLSRLTGTDTQVIRDLEVGLPKTIPTKISDFFLTTIEPIILDRQYNDWRRFKRSLVFLPPVGQLSISSDVHPFAQYRKQIDVSASSLCEYICVPRFVIMHYESGQRKMPRLLQDVLPQVHMSELDVHKLNNLGQVFYVNQEQIKIKEQQRAHG